MTRPRRVGRVRRESFSGRCNGYSGPNRPADRMSNREPDFEFDFFDEPPTEEASGQRSLRRPLRGGPKEPRGPRRPIRPGAGFTPLARLVGLVAFAILIVVLLVLWVQSCQEDQRRDAYRSYLGDVSAVARDSERLGRELNDVLTTPGIKPADLDQQLAGLVQQQQIGADRAAELDAPGPLRRANRSVTEALQFRVNGLQGLAAEFRNTRGSKDAAASGALLAAQAQRLDRERRDLGGPVQGSSGDRAPRAGHHGRRGSRLELRPDARPREHPLDGADLAAPERHDDDRRRNRRGPPRHEHRRHSGAAGGPAALDQDREHDRRVDRPRPSTSASGTAATTRK